MKKTLLFICTFISFATISQAQITKGSVLLGGNIGLSKGKTESSSNASYNESSKSHTINFNPSVGLAIKENWVIGIHAGFGDYEAEPSVNYPYKRDEERYSAGMFVRRYWALGKNFYLFGDGSINFSLLNRSESNNNHYENYLGTKGVNLSVSPGITYTINKRFHLELSLTDLFTAGYAKTYTQYSTLNNGIITGNSTDSKSFDVGTNFSNTVPLSIGFRFVLGK